VVVPGAGSQDRPQMCFATDQHPADALGPNGPYRAFGITVRPGCPRRSLHDRYALPGEDLADRGRERCVAVPDEESPPTTPNRSSGPCVEY